MRRPDPIAPGAALPRLLRNAFLLLPPEAVRTDRGRPWCLQFPHQPAPETGRVCERESVRGVHTRGRAERGLRHGRRTTVARAPRCLEPGDRLGATAPHDRGQAASVGGRVEKRSRGRPVRAPARGMVRAPAAPVRGLNDARRPSRSVPRPSRSRFRAGAPRAMEPAMEQRTRTRWVRLATAVLGMVIGYLLIALL